MKLLDLLAQQSEHIFPLLGQRVLLARSGTGIGIDLELQPAPFLHARQKRIQRSRADLVAVATQLADHPLAEDGAGLGVVQDVYLPKGEQELSLDVLHRASPIL